MSVFLISNMFETWQHWCEKMDQNLFVILKLYVKWLIKTTKKTKTKHAYSKNHKNINK